MESNEQRDAGLWKIARKRASFKKHLITYVLINAFFWVLWWWDDGSKYSGVPWPVFPMAGWGLGLAFNYFEAYGSDQNTLAEKEYERLRKEQKNN